MTREAPETTPHRGRPESPDPRGSDLVTYPGPTRKRVRDPERGLHMDLTNHVTPAQTDSGRWPDEPGGGQGGR